MTEASQLSDNCFSVAQPLPGLNACIRALATSCGCGDALRSVCSPEAGCDTSAVMASAESIEHTLAELVQRAIDADGAKAVVIGGGPLARAARALAPRFDGRCHIVEPIPVAVARVARLLQPSDALPAATRAALAAVYPDPAALAALETHLSTPCEALHVRCNLLRRERSAVQAMLQSQLDNTFRVAPHPILFDVLVIRRTACDACLTPFLELRHIHGTDRFAARKRHGLPVHEVLVDLLCGEAVLKGADIFVRGVRGASAGLVAGERVSVYADLHGTLLRGSVCESLEGMALLGVGTCLLDRPAIFREASGLAVKIEHIVAGDLPAIGNLLNAKGEFYVQSLPSLVVAHVLNAQPGERILDMCAAPGSKRRTLRPILRDTEGSALYAVERHHGKLAKLATLCKEDFGLECVIPTRADSTRLPTASTEEVVDVGDAKEASVVDADATTTTRKKKKKTGGGGVPPLDFEKGSFDRILLDPPCSALGLRPRLLLSKLMSDGVATISQTANYQKAFLWGAVQLLKVGGILVYSTCTLTAEENEAQVTNALRTYQCLRLVAAEPRVGRPGRVGFGLSEEQCAMVQRFEPADGTEGFFIARFEKVNE